MNKDKLIKYFLNVSSEDLLYQPAIALVDAITALATPAHSPSEEAPHEVVKDALINLQSTIERLEGGEKDITKICLYLREDFQALKDLLPALAAASPAPNIADADGSDWRSMRVRGYLRQWLTPHQYEIIMDCLREAAAEPGRCDRNCVRRP